MTNVAPLRVPVTLTADLFFSNSSCEVARNGRRLIWDQIALEFVSPVSAHPEVLGNVAHSLGKLYPLMSDCRTLVKFKRRFYVEPRGAGSKGREVKVVSDVL